MAMFKQWTGWVIFCAILPSAAVLLFAQHTLKTETAFYLTAVPSLLLYFLIVGWLGLEMPGIARKASPGEAASPVSGLERLKGWIRSVVFLFVMPALGAGLIFYGVRDGEIAGYFLGPAMIWVSGGVWSSVGQVLRESRQERKNG